MELAFEHPFDVTSYGGKLFQVKQTKKVIETSIKVADTATKEGKELQEMVRKEWLTIMTKFVKEKESEYRDIFMDTERRLYATAAKRSDEFAKAGDKAAVAKSIVAWLEKEADGANVMIKQALITFERVVKTMMEDAWKKVSAAFDKKHKGSISKAKVLAVVKIIGLALVVVAGAALTIAASVLGAMAAPTGVGLVAGIGLALGGLATSITASKKIYDIYAANWPTHKSAMSTLQKKTKALAEALAYENSKIEKTSDGNTKLGPKERLKLYFGNTAGKRKELAEALKTVNNWTVSIKQDIEKEGQAELVLEKQLDQLEDKIKKAPDDKTKAAIEKQFNAGIKTIADSRSARENARRYLIEIEAAMKEGAELVGTESKLSTSNIALFAAKVDKLANSKTMDVLITVGKAGKEFVTNLLKFLKTVK